MGEGLAEHRPLLRAWGRLPGGRTGGGPEEVWGDWISPLSPASPLPTAEGRSSFTSGSLGGSESTQTWHAFRGWDDCAPPSYRVLSDAAPTQRKAARWERRGCFAHHRESVRCPELPEQRFDKMLCWRGKLAQGQLVFRGLESQGCLGKRGSRRRTACGAESWQLT